MARTAHITNPESGPRRRSTRSITPVELAIIVAAALEMLLLVGGLLWAVTAPPGTSLWGRIVLVTSIAILAALIAVFASAPAFRAVSTESKGPSDSSD